MNVKSVEKENGNAKIAIEIEKAEFEVALNKAYAKCRKNIMIPGFRKGKAPRKMVESMYGPTVFYEDAVNEIFPEIYEKAVTEQGLKAVGAPSVVDMDTTEEGNVALTVSTALYPEVTLGEYKGIEVAKKAVSVGKADVDAELNRMAERNSRIETVEREAKNGDTVVIDFEGFVDGKAFEGGKAEKYNLHLGTGAFIPGFEDQLVGAEIGADVDVNVTFPEQYHSEELAGKAVVFHVHVNSIREKEMPELDEDFVKEVSETANTVDEYKAEIRERLESQAENRAESAFENEVIEKVVENAEVDIPAAMIEDQIDNMLRDMEMRMMYQGMKLDDYFKYTGQTREQVREMYKAPAEERVKTQLVVAAVMKAEEIKADEAEIDVEIGKYAEQNKKSLDEFKAMLSDGDKEYFSEIASLQKTIAFLKDHAE